MFPIESNLQHVNGVIRDAIAGLADERKRPVTLVAVSKTKPAEAVREAFAAGQRHFGENYVQEGVGKIVALADLRPQGITWHYLGPLQSNKAKQVALHFDWMHGLDRPKIASALGAERAGMPPLNVCVQVNASGESSKSGVSPGEALAFATGGSRDTGAETARPDVDHREFARRVHTARTVPPDAAVVR
jgi:hypothetical protein